MRLIRFSIFALSAIALISGDDDVDKDALDLDEIDPDIIDRVHFLIYEKGLQDFSELKIEGPMPLDYRAFNPNKTTKVLIHGWLDGGTDTFCKMMKDAYLRYDDFNIISVDWSDLSVNLYSVARLAVDVVSPYVAKLFDYLQKDLGVKPSNIHAIGHSLGAHIAGMAGAMASSKIGRITGLDPAAPLFFFGKSFRLDESDADFVDVIHTSLIGFRKPIGHADFYPNGDKVTQPGCGLEIFVCEHSRAYEYYIESIESERGFWAARCLTWDDFKEGDCDSELVLMGEPLSHNARGTYYLATSSSSPYALGRPFST